MDPSRSTDLHHSFHNAVYWTYCTRPGIEPTLPQRQVVSLTYCATAGTPHIFLAFLKQRVKRNLTTSKEICICKVLLLTSIIIYYCLYEGSQSLEKHDRIFRARKAYWEPMKEPLSVYLPIRRVKLFTFQRFMNQKGKGETTNLDIVFFKVSQGIAASYSPSAKAVQSRNMGYRKPCVTMILCITAETKIDSGETLESECDKGLESNFRIQNKFA